MSILSQMIYINQLNPNQNPTTFSYRNTKNLLYANSLGEKKHKTMVEDLYCTACHFKAYFEATVINRGWYWYTHKL